MICEASGQRGFVTECRAVQVVGVSGRHDVHASACRGCADIEDKRKCYTAAGVSALAVWNMD